MEKCKDAFGQVMYDHLKGKGGLAIIERDDGLFEVDTFLNYYFADYRKWMENEKKAIRWAKGKVLDIGCGAGRVGLYLQNKGLDVLSVDNSPLALKVCKARGLKKTKLLSITQLTHKVGLFDTIIMYGNNFGLLSNRNRAKWLLRRFYRMTSADALIIAESFDPYNTRNPDYLEYHKLNRARGRMSGQLRLRVRYKKYVSDWLDYLLVSKNEMQEILDGTGWQVKRFIDSKDLFYIAIIEKDGCYGNFRNEY
ncbi:MAG: class I SAM-dependent methyltransferase [Planctomycetota bacterium]|jgi:SAM-dependent methyltransferase